MQQDNLKKLPDMNAKDIKRIMINFEKRLVELRHDLDIIYKEAKVRNIKKKIIS